MNKQMLVRLDPNNLDSINDHLNDGWNIGQQYTFKETTDIIVVLYKFIPNPGLPMYNNYQGQY